MDWDIRLLRAFVTVAQEGSFTRGAAKLRMSQPSLSLQVKDLEKRMGLHLLHRSTRRVELTPEGMALLANAERLIAETDRVDLQVQALRKQNASLLKVGSAFYTMDIPERTAFVEAFLATYPTLDVEFQTRWQAELIEAVGNHHLDAALVIGRSVSPDEPDRQRRGELVFSSKLRKIILATQQINIVVPKENRLASQPIIEPADLRGERVAMMGIYHGEAVIGPLRDLLLGVEAIPFTPPESNALGVERYSRQFRMIGMTTGWFGREPLVGDMIRRDIAGFQHTTELALISDSDFEKPVIRKFWAFASDWLASRNCRPPP